MLIPIVIPIVLAARLAAPFEPTGDPRRVVRGEDCSSRRCDRREDAAGQQKEKHSPEDPWPVFERAGPIRGAEDQDGRRHGEERPGLEVQLEKRVHPVVEEDPLCEKNEKKRGGEKSKGQTVFRLSRHAEDREEKQQNGADAKRLRRQKPYRQNERRHQIDEQARSHAGASPGEVCGGGRRPPGERKKDEEAEVGEHVRPAGAALYVPSEAGTAATPDPQRA